METVSSTIEKPVVAWGRAAVEKGIQGVRDDPRYSTAEQVRLDLELCDSELRFVADRA